MVKISWISQKSSCVSNKVAGLQILQHGCFPLEFAKFLRATTLKNICERMLLKSLSTMKILFRILQEFRNFFQNNTSERLLRHFSFFNVMALHLKIHRRIQHPLKHIRCFCKMLLVRCLTVFRIPLWKKRF